MQRFMRGVGVGCVWGGWGVGMAGTLLAGTPGLGLVGVGAWMLGAGIAAIVAGALLHETFEG